MPIASGGTTTSAPQTSVSPGRSCCKAHQTGQTTCLGVVDPPLRETTTRRHVMLAGFIGEASLAKQIKSAKELESLVEAALGTAADVQRHMPISIEGHIRDGLGRNWDLASLAPSPAHRKAIDGVRDLYDLG